MSGSNPARGEVTVDLGELGEVVCRPGFRALSKIDGSPGGPLTAMLDRFKENASLNDVVTILYETHLDFDPKSKIRPDQIGQAVIDIGIDNFFVPCATLILRAWSPRVLRDEEESAPEAEGDEGN